MHLRTRSREEKKSATNPMSNRKTKRFDPDGAQIRRTSFQYRLHCFSIELFVVTRPLLTFLMRWHKEHLRWQQPLLYFLPTPKCMQTKATRDDLQRGSPQPFSQLWRPCFCEWQKTDLTFISKKEGVADSKNCFFVIQTCAEWLPGFCVTANLWGGWFGHTLFATHSAGK